MISLYFREGFFNPFFVVSKVEFFKLDFKTARKNGFFNGATSNRFLYVNI